MNILIADLCKVLNKFSKVLVYGEGIYAENVCKLLKKAGMEEKIKAFLTEKLSEESKKDDGIPVIRLADLKEEDGKECVLLVAKIGTNSREIANTLSGKFQQILLLDDYVMTEEKLETVSEEQFLTYIRECHVWDSIHSLLELKTKNEEEQKKIEQRETEASDEKTIVFIIGNLNRRDINIVEDLITKNYKVILIEYGKWEIENRNALIGMGKSLEYFKCSDIADLMYQIIQYKPAVYCCKPVWGERRWINILMKYPKIFGKIAISFHDIFEDGYMDRDDGLELAQKYFVEASSKVVWKYFEKEEVLLVSACDFSEKGLRKVSDEQFQMQIVEGYVWNNINSLAEYQTKVNKEKIKLLQKEMFQDIEEKTVVFIIGFLSPRTVRIIGTLIQKGYRAVILEYGNWRARNVTVKPELLTYNIEYVRCEDIGELFYHAMQYKPIVYYFEPVWGNCSCPDIMIRHKKIFGKIAMAIYDVLNDGYVQATDYRKKLEKYCLENADGIIWRYFSKEFLEEKKGFVYKGKSVQFLDYCGGYNIEEKADEETKLKLCFISGSPQMLLDSTNANNGYVEEAKIENILKVIGNRDDCEFHIFAGTLSEEYQEICSALEKEYFNFRVIYNTPHEELIKAISEYDYGCFFFTGGETIPEMETINNKYYGSVYINSISNRYFDYIDAELPIITTRPTKLCELFDEYGIIAKMDISNIDIDYLKANKMNYKKNIKKAKKELGMDNQIQRLIEFFEEL